MWPCGRACRSVWVWARRRGSAEAVAAATAQRGHRRSVQGDLPAAVAQADIVSCATTATAPLVQGAWLRPGTHLDLVGGFRPDMREVDDAAVARCAPIVVDTRAGALAEAGDLVQPLARGVITPERIVRRTGRAAARRVRRPHGRRSDHAVQVGRHGARRPGRRAARAAALMRRQAPRRTRRNSSTISRTAPSVMALSARLKLGKYQPRPVQPG